MISLHGVILGRFFGLAFAFSTPIIHEPVQFFFEDTGLLFRQGLLVLSGHQYTFTLLLLDAAKAALRV